MSGGERVYSVYNQFGYREGFSRTDEDTAILATYIGYIRNTLGDKYLEYMIGQEIIGAGNKWWDKKIREGWRAVEEIEEF